MESLIFKIYEFLTDIPVNIWAWLLLITAPFLVFYVKPDAPRKIRRWRLILAIVISYVLINLALHTSHQIMGAEYDNNPNATSEDLDRVVGACGASDFFMLFFGWIWVTGYTGLYELFWRIKYRKKIKSIFRGVGDDWVSTFIIIISFFVTLFVILIIITFIKYAVLKVG